jgi:hypothetical protein
VIPPVNVAVLPKRSPRLLAAVLALAGAVWPLAAFAQDAVPSYAHHERVAERDTIRGRIESFDGKFHMIVRDDRGQAKSVELHQGTVIQPTGLTLTPGMSVAISGYNGRDFNANVISTPYTYDGPKVYCGPPGWWYSYGPDVLLLDCPELAKKLQMSQFSFGG